MSSGLLGACISVVVIGIVYSHVVPEDEKAIELGMVSSYKVLLIMFM